MQNTFKPTSPEIMEATIGRAVKPYHDLKRPELTYEPVTARSKSIWTLQMSHSVGMGRTVAEFAWGVLALLFVFGVGYGCYIYEAYQQVKK